MALWIDRNGEQFDDGDILRPGEDGFSRDKAHAHFGGDDFDYLGTPNWRSLSEEQGT